MGTWKTYKLGDVAKFHDNKRIPLSSLQRQEHQGAYPYYGAACILDYVDGYLFDGDFILVGEDGTVITPEGKAVVQWVTGKFWVNNHAHVITARKDFSQRFLYYLLSEFRIGPYVTGAAQPKVSKGRLEVVKISLPPLEEQERIAGVLGAYDDLIAVNERRMALLEEAAHRLYRDRFVTHANSDWPLRPLGEVAPLRRGKIITEATAQPGCVPVVAGGLEPAYWHNQANTTAPVLTVAGSGANAGFARLYYEDVWASDCSYVDRSEQAPVYFAYCFLKDNKRKIENFKRGAAQPHVYPADLNALEGHFDRESIQTFEAQVSPYFEAIGVLARENVLLREGRDKLLPRLLREEA